ncbi:PP2C family protein-serine/threonine phosphatase [Conexibacter sp. DBS9H8]|uniref:PP2C family protein-serine/threonine phosphatase n=1 Tax=Conexibacter sp. DBS9H8 TaxID=2937801 RepID=UPI00200DEF7C|nr:PP2C family protein-serine/threonine phosphatase [Conexibacter sp. DBS9H8]
MIVDPLQTFADAAVAPPALPPRRLALLADSGAVADELSRILVALWPDFEVQRVGTLPALSEQLGRGLACVIVEVSVTDVALPWRHLLDEIRSITAHVPVVAVTADRAAGEALVAAGARDFLLRDRIESGEVARVVRRSIQLEQTAGFQRATAALRSQSAEAARIQRGLIPRFIVSEPRIATRSGYRPGDRRMVLGGDFFDVVQRSPHTLNLVLGDVCGHGADEAALGVVLRIAWRTLVLAGTPHDQILHTLDRIAARERHADHIFATVASVEIDLTASQARVSLAGHPSPLLERDGAIQIMTGQPGGPPLGLGLPPGWAVDQVDLGHRWALMLFSDGLYEGHVNGRAERLELTGLVELLAGTGPDALWRAAPDALLDRVEALNGGPLNDDVALLVVRLN